MLKNLTSRLPLPVTVLALGWVILGNILKDIIPLLSDICMIISMMLLIITILKIVLSPRGFYKGIKSPAGLSMFSSFSMSLMLISVWMKGFLGKANIYIWIIGVILHTVILIVFTIKYVLNFKIKYVFSSWFLVYSGIGIAAITCNDFGMIVFGRSVLKFTVFVSLLILPFVLARLKIMGSTQAAKPIFSLICVPLGIIVPAMVSINEPASSKVMWAMFTAIQILLLVVIIDMLIHLFMGFYPSWSCYTVAIVISVYSSMYFNKYLAMVKMRNYFVESLLYFEYVLAFVVCSIVLLAYFINTLEDPEVHKKKLHDKAINEKRIREKKIKEKMLAVRNKKYGSKKDSMLEKSNLTKVKTDFGQTKTLFEDDDIDEISDLLD